MVCGAIEWYGIKWEICGKVWETPKTKRAPGNVIEFEYIKRFGKHPKPKGLSAHDSDKPNGRSEREEGSPT